jgi:hypothetical protein
MRKPPGLCPACRKMAEDAPRCAACVGNLRRWMYDTLREEWPLERVKKEWPIDNGKPLLALIKALEGGQ